MMVDKRLLGEVPQTKTYILACVAMHWLSLLANIWMAFSIAELLEVVLSGGAVEASLASAALAMVAAAMGRFSDALVGSMMGLHISRAVKSTLRNRVIAKLLRLGPAYRDIAPTSEIVQVASEGVEQLETYFAQYLPQLFYALLAPLTLFAFLAPVNLPAAAVLLACVPLIPASIIVVQRWAKRLLARYWGHYTELGDTFLENLQGLTTLKIYRADEFKQREMNDRAEQFRRITMRVLIMQLNSISIMDLVAYGGAALGCVLALVALRDGAVNISGAVAIALLSAEFFLPMRLLGSYFHIAMNGMAASEKLFRILDAPEPDGAAMGAASSQVAANFDTATARGPAAGGEPVVAHDAAAGRKASGTSPAGRGPCGTRALDIELCDVDFSFESARPVLSSVSLAAHPGSLTAIVGTSGSGKSTVAALMLGRISPQRGRVMLACEPLDEMTSAEVLELVTYVGHQSYLFAGTVRENLLMARPEATDDDLWAALEKAQLAAFLRAEAGLDTRLTERAANLSGGQRQRLAIARAILHDTPIYIFDEATSNIDMESEDAVAAAIEELSRTKTVLVIAHRLANVVDAACIYVLCDGVVAEAGTHAELVARQSVYAELWHAQRELEEFGIPVEDEEA